MAGTFRTIAKILTGAGSIRQLGGVVAALGKRALIVTGSGSVSRSGALAKARESLSEAGIDFEEHPGVLPEPDLATVELVRGRIHEGFDVVVSIGGGSVIDAAKAAAGLAREDGSVREYQAGRAVETRGVAHIAVPTTAGTGAEVTPNAVITDPDGPLKSSIRGETLYPAAAVVDPELLLTLPKRLTAESGMDALVQAIESYVSIHATPLTDALSLHAITLLARGLVSAYEDGADLDARSDCASGSLAAGVALANARLGVVHGIAHPLGARLGVAHGQVCATLLPASIRLNVHAAPEKYDEVSRRLLAGFSTAGSRGVTAPGLTPDEVERKAPRADVLIDDLLVRLDMPKTIPGLTPDAFPVIVKESMPSGSLKANPLTIEEKHVEELLREVTG